MPVEPLSDVRLTAAAAKLPAAPRIFQQLSAAIKDPDVSVEAMVTVVRLDPVLSARVIRASNSTHFARGGNIVSLDGAIERIGIYEVYQLVGAAVASQLYSAGLPVYGISGDQLWENSVTTAVALDYLSEAAGEDGRIGYTLGLLRPVGRLLLQRIASEYTCAPLIGRHASAALVETWELEALGATSTEAINRVFQLWEYPLALTDPIRYQFRPAADPSSGRMTALLHCASWVAMDLGKGLAIEQDAWNITEDVLRQAAIDDNAVAKCTERTRRIADRLNGLLRAA